ncbi:MAG: hypothetical protein ACLPUG_14405 [Acidimicrobiales bacterium]|jgi:hypothetical protein
MKAAGIVLAENYLLNTVVTAGIGQFLAIIGPSSRHIIDTMACPVSRARAGQDA